MKRKNKNIPRNQIKFDKQYTILMSFILFAAIVIAVLGYSFIKTTTEENDDEDKFLNIQMSVPRMAGELQSISPDGVEWLKNDRGDCEYKSGTGLLKGGWYCAIGTSATLPINTPNLKKYIYEFNETVRKSPDFKYKSTGSFKDFPEKLVEGGGMSSIYTTWHGDISCSLRFSLPDRTSTAYTGGDIAGSFNCGDGALKSWYPNSESGVRIDGQDAWK